MSRVGNKPIEIPAGVSVQVQSEVVRVKGPKAELTFSLPHHITVEQKEKLLVVVAANAGGDHTRALHGMVRARIANMVGGVTKDFSKNLELHGLGFRAEVVGDKLKMTLGLSHPVEFALPKGIKCEVDKKQTKVSVLGSDKDLVGQTAAQIRQLKKPEPYKGFGIRYEGERIHRKAGKTAAGAGAGGAKK
ncbi:MAG: large subunit ribosomal protein L6 [Elusimicrobia bacterium]|nr:MAG: large subunit ribosomal protein L6 [Elusimicrobiota bacterium]